MRFNEIDTFVTRILSYGIPGFILSYFFLEIYDPLQYLVWTRSYEWMVLLLSSYVLGQSLAVIQNQINGQLSVLVFGDDKKIFSSTNSSMSKFTKALLNIRDIDSLNKEKLIKTLQLPEEEIPHKSIPDLVYDKAILNSVSHSRYVYLMELMGNLSIAMLVITIASLIVFKYYSMLAIVTFLFMILFFVGYARYRFMLTRYLFNVLINTNENH
ncbi:hypothetical protein [Spirochaeta cellobiosiphila]|uniref:hypothetical protein n=1 Tax=Spirochaeta cellobiosiphila TaxID=504483 RepID=UPI00040621EF|nr:hypothetical protein [Spirochaeta cellobiosiphila]